MSAKNTIKSSMLVLFSTIQYGASVIFLCFIYNMTIWVLFQFFNNALMLGKSSESEVSDRLYDLIYELNQISPNVLLSVLPQLEFKLKVRFVK